MKKKLKKLLKLYFPKLVKIIKIVKEKKDHITFEGWGMITYTINTPWLDNKNKEALLFNRVHQKILKSIKNETFIDTTPNNTKDDTIEMVEGLKWRHYIILYTINIVSNFTKNRVFVECGVGDGLSSVYILHTINKDKSKLYLYDSWSPMKKKYLISKNEIKNVGNYKNLKLSITKNNLKKFSSNIIYNVGDIPEVFENSKNPRKISWLHIDLNSSIPTLGSLEFFYDKLEKNGIILFDDYGWKNYEDTKRIVDKFLKSKKGSFMQFPTGQGFFIKNE